MLNNKLRIFSSLVLALLTACSKPPEVPGKLEIILGMRNDTIVLDLVNNSAIRQPASSEYSYSSGMGNVHSIIVSDLGGMHKFCNPVDDRGAFWKSGFIDAGKSIEIWHGTPELLATFYCLGKGRYTLAFVYQKPSGELLFSNQAELVVGDSLPQAPHIDAYIEIGETPPMVGSDDNPSSIR